MHDFEPGWDTYKEGPGYVMESDLTFDDVRSATTRPCCASAAARRSICATTRGPRHPARVRREQKKWIFAICHGVQLVAAAGLLKGKTVTCYEHVRLEAEAAGGHYVAPRPSATDSSFVTNLARASRVLSRDDGVLDADGRHLSKA